MIRPAIVIRELLAELRLAEARRHAVDVVLNCCGLAIEDYRMLLLAAAGRVADATAEWDAAYAALESESRSAMGAGR